MSDQPLRILLAALGGEGGGVLMNWIVNAGRAAGRQVQATSIPGVAQRTGSTSYYVEIAGKDEPNQILSLVPLPGRVDVVVCSELVEAARVMESGFVSPKLTTLVSSTARYFSTAEKIHLGDGRFSDKNIRTAADKMAKESFLLDLGQLASDNNTFVSATMFGALAGSGALPWGVAHSRAVLSDARSEAGFDAAVKAINALKANTDAATHDAPPTDKPIADRLPEGLQTVLTLGAERAADFQDADYADRFTERAQRLVTAADLSDHRAAHAVIEACRRLALWMAYEDVARVADLKTRPERFEGIRKDVQLEPGQILTVTEYMKPRAEEIADILPMAIGKRVMVRAKRGGWFPFLGKGRYIRSNGVVGYRLLRLVAGLKRFRPRSLRFAEEQAAIEDWLNATEMALTRSPDFAMGLGELPRVLKGYSDTLKRGKSAYARIMEGIVHPALAEGNEDAAAKHLRDAIGAALADDSHIKLDAVLAGEVSRPEIPNLKTVAHA